MGHRLAAVQMRVIALGACTGAALRVAYEKMVGIDLGTTDSIVASMEGRKPSLVGQIAKRHAIINLVNTFFSIKRFIGRKIFEVNDEAKAGREQQRQAEMLMLFELSLFTHEISVEMLLKFASE